MSEVRTYKRRIRRSMKILVMGMLTIFLAVGILIFRECLRTAMVMGLGFMTVRTEQGKLHLLIPFDGFHDFLTWLKANNPSAELRGCW